MDESSNARIVELLVREARWAWGCSVGVIFNLVSSIDRSQELDLSPLKGLDLDQQSRLIETLEVVRDRKKLAEFAQRIIDEVG